jgi:hypothetical protein
MMRSSKAAGFSVLIAAAFLAACGGGGGQHTTVPATLPSGGTTTLKVATGPTAPVTITVKIPSRTASKAARALLAKRKPSYVSPSTMSMQVFTLPSDTGQSVDCTSGGTCTLTFPATASDTSIVVQLFDGTGACCNVLSQGTAALTLVAGVPSSVTLTLDGVTQQIAIGGGPSSFVVNYPTSFTLTTTFPDAQANLIGTIGNVIDSGGSIIIGGTGVPNNVLYNVSDASTLAVGASTFNAGPLNYSQTQTVSYNGGVPAPTSTPLVIQAQQNGGSFTTSNALQIPVLTPLTLSEASPGPYQFIAPALTAGTPNYTAQFVDLTPVSANLTVTANFGAFATLPTMLSVTSDTCTGPTYISGLSPSLASPVPFTAGTAPLSFNISASNPTGTAGCTILFHDDAGPPVNTLSLQIFIDNAQIFIQGKNRK